MSDTNIETTAYTLTTTEDESTRAADVAAAEALVVEWATSIIPLGRNIHKMVHTERLCREAVASGMMRVRLGSNPAIIHVRALSHARTWDKQQRCFVRDQAHISCMVNLKSVHIYLEPSNDDTSEDHRVISITAIRTQASRAFLRAAKEARNSVVESK
ncbi:hypothetical protein Q9L58_006255 [Maublancomyces gigas]|uniref:Uncharacterized protein n=1 Tax=Discina gigas TaxID=1032678 RepID=A0ABR3GFT1_9PEZI